MDQLQSVGRNTGWWYVSTLLRGELIFDAKTVASVIANGALRPRYTCIHVHVLSSWLAYNPVHIWHHSKHPNNAPNQHETVSNSITTKGRFTSQYDPCKIFQRIPETPPTSFETTSDSTTETALLDTTDNTAAIVGGVVAVMIVLAMTCIVIAVLVTKNPTYKYCVDQAVG